MTTRNTWLIFFAGMAALCVLAFGDAGNRSTVGYAIGAAGFVLMAGMIMHIHGWKTAYKQHIAQCEAISKDMSEKLTVNKEYAASLTRAEQNIVKALHQAVEDFEKLEEQHPGEQQRFCEHVYDASAIVLARVGLRSAVIMQAQDAQGS
jgi:hypothetical protein